MIKVLIAEDEFLIAYSLATGLKLLGYEVSKPVSSGEQAVQRAGEERPDIVVMDLGLAGAMNGLQAARCIREQFNVPVLFMSGYVDEQILAAMAPLQPVACLTKPAGVRDVDQALKEHFG